MNKRVILTILGAMLLFGGPLVLPAPELGDLAGARPAPVSRA